MTVSVIIPNWNGARLLEKVLDRLHEQTHPIEEVVVVDNGSQDDSVAVAESRGARVLRLDWNAGFSGAVNRGIAAVSTPWLVILNNDVEPERSWLGTLAGQADAEGTWFATGKLLSADVRDRIDGTWDAICRGGTTWRCGSGRPDGDPWNHQHRILFAPLTAALFRREVFDRVGFLDESFESYLEDVDFGLRCATKSIYGVYVSNAIAYHRGSATLGRWNPETVRRIARNQVLLVAKHYPEHWFRRFGWPVFVAQGLWGLVAFRHGAGLAWFRGKWQGISSFRSTRRTHRPVPLEILEQSEREILELQQQTGFDTYWKFYFALTRALT